MNTEPLTSEAILDAAEAALRRFGPAKTSVVDVARALEVSHGSVYRHFPSKAALREAVTARWLERVSAPLEDVVAHPGPASSRLRDWVALLAATKQAIARDEPELFETFYQIATGSRDVAAVHVDHLADQAARIVADGIAAGEFTDGDPAVLGRAVLHATARFHHPALSREWADPATTTADLDAVLTLILHGLTGPE